MPKGLTAKVFFLIHDVKKNDPLPITANLCEVILIRIKKEG